MKQKPADWPHAVVFDLDGTLIDSAADLTDALNYALNVRGLSPFQPPQVKEMIGGGIPKLVERALRAQGVTDVEFLPLAADFVKYYRDNLTLRTKLYDGAEEVLSALKRQGRRLAVCSNKQHDLTVELLAQLKISKYFNVVAGERERHARKPDPAPLLAALHTLGVTPEEAVMVGDGAADAQCARAAGVALIAASYGYGNIDPHKPGVVAVIDRIGDLPNSLAWLQPPKE